MTNQEAIKAIKANYPTGGYYNLCQALDMAISALEQEPMREFTEEEAKAYSEALDKMYKPTGFNVFDEPCGDAISRDYAMRRFSEEAYPIVHGINSHDIGMTLYGIRQLLQELPLVNPQEPKTGHWIKKNGYNDCSECGSHIVGEWDYCPKCGAKMVKPKESEEISDRNMKMWEEIFKAESEE